MSPIPTLRRIIRKQIISPVQEFIKDSRAVGITLLACTALSLILTNTGWGSSYLALIEREIHLSDTLHLPHSLLHWINDGLMAVFFFLVGMEIKRELLIGELSSLKKASLPIAGAIGGMLVPAAIYLFFNAKTEFQAGWGIPMATDIAFSLGVASLLGNRVPVTLKIFLMALAIIDDLGAILVIALFYGNDFSWMNLLYAAIVYALLLGLLKWKKNSLLVIIVGGILLWYFIFNSGIHATIAGVLLAFVVPLEKLGDYIHGLHDPVNFIILPLFALANTAILLPDDIIAGFSSSLSWGVLIGLVVGKPIGITLLAWLTVKMGWGEKPAGTSWTQILGIGILAGIGFTMSIFITMLAFSTLETQNISKLAILAGAILSVTLGLITLGLAHQAKAAKD